jgi:hypothetical protein
MAHVFISYSHKDSRYAHELANKLSERGIEVWIDDRIEHGTIWPRVIQENLDSCPILIVIMSPHSYASDWVQNEVSYAQGQGKAIFPILLEGDVWASLAAKQRIDGRRGKLPDKSFYDLLRQTLGIRKSLWEGVKDELGLDKDSLMKELGFDRESLWKALFGGPDDERK